MNKIQWTLAGTCLLISSCTIISVTPAVRPDASPKAGNGYISAMVSGEKNANFAFVIRNTTTGVDYRMSLGEGPAYRPIVNEVSAIDVPPGRYAVISWVTFATLTKGKLVEKAIHNPVLKMPFVVEPGSVTFLGDFAISYNNYVAAGGVTMSWRIDPLRVDTGVARSAFISSYPTFRDSAFSCRLCLDSIPGILQSGSGRNATN